MTPCDINTEVIVVLPEAGVVQKYATYTSEYLMTSYNDEQELLVIPVKHTTWFQLEGLREDKKFYVFPGKNACTYKYFGGLGLHDTHEGSCSLIDDQGIKEKVADFLFLFFPRKEKFQAEASRTCDAWSLFSLKEVGWGPPEDRDALEDAWRTNPIRVHNHPDGRVQIRLKFPFILLFGRVSRIGIYLFF